MNYIQRIYFFCSEEIEVNEFLTTSETVEYLKNRLNIDNIFIFTKNEANGFYYPVDANKRLYEFKSQLYAHNYTLEFIMNDIPKLPIEFTVNQ